jgi:hypothetical protein
MECTPESGHFQSMYSLLCGLDRYWGFMQLWNIHKPWTKNADVLSENTFMVVVGIKIIEALEICSKALVSKMKYLTCFS